MQLKKDFEPINIFSASRSHFFVLNDSEGIAYRLPSDFQKSIFYLYPQ